jgi:CheY-like chemotaxis protein
MEGFGPRQLAEPRNVLLVEDDPGDALMIREALETYAPETDIAAVVDGVDALRYLRREDEFADEPRPDLVLLDLNMPRKDGREALAEIKSDPGLRAIPVVVLTTSSAEADVLRSYELGVNSFITKPVTFAGLVEVMQGFTRYWFEIVELPARAIAGSNGQS